MTSDSGKRQRATSWLEHASENRAITAMEARRRSTSPRGQVTGAMLARVLLVTILVLNGVWIGGFWALNRAVVTPRVQADLALHVRRIEALLRQPNRTAPKTLNSLETEFQAATADLTQLDGLLPLGGHWPFGATRVEHHLLQLALNTTQAAQYVITAIPYVQPIEARAEQSFIDAGAQPGAAAPGAPLALQTINQAQFNLDTARQFWQAAQQERQLLTVAEVAALHEPEASAFLAQYDQLAPTVSTGLELTSSLLDWSPTALGVTAPDHFLLLVVDPSDLRSGGGRVWDYADLETSGGTLVSGVHLQSAQSLDCPQGVCGARPVPPGNEWFPLNHNQFGLTDATLDPGLPGAAPTIETIYQLESGKHVDGVITLTPGLYADLLRVTGPITLPGSRLPVTSTNVEALLAAEHEALPATGAVKRSSAPDIEAYLTQAILARIAGANTTLRSRLGAALTDAMQSKDLSFYGNSPRVEAMLTQLGMAGDIAMPTGDTWLVSDTNDGLTAINPLVAESVTDNVTLDAQGAAQHSLTISYTYHTSGAWSGAYPLRPYSDFFRVIAPKDASLPHLSGSCAPVSVSQPGFSVAGCQFTLQPGATTVIHASWVAPAQPAARNGQFSLLIQRQPGANVAVKVSVVAPPGYGFSHPEVRSGAPLRLVGDTLVWEAGSLTQNTLMSATLSRP